MRDECVRNGATEEKEEEEEVEEKAQGVETEGQKNIHYIQRCEE